MKRIFIACFAALIANSNYADIQKSSTNSIYKTSLTPRQHSLLLTHPPKATSKVNVQINLNATDSVISDIFNPNDPDTFDYVVQSIIYDSLGATHIVSYYFAKSSVNTWSVYPLVDSSIIGAGSIVFNTSGNILHTTGMANLSFSPSTGATSPQIFSADFSGSTQYAGSSRLSSMDQDGYPYEPDFHSKSAL